MQAAIAERKAGEAFTREHWLESIRGFTVAIDLVRELLKTEKTSAEPTRKQELARLFFRRWECQGGKWRPVATTLVHLGRCASQNRCKAIVVRLRTMVSIVERAKG